MADPLEPQGRPPKLRAPLVDRVDSLPRILAGPILRHVDKNSVTVWLALRRAKQVKLTVSVSDTGTTVLQSGTETTLKVGEHLHLIAITAKSTSASGGLVPGTLYAYNLQFTPDPEDGDDKSGDLLTEGFFVPIGAGSAKAADLLGYGGLGLPTFALPPTKVTQLRVLQGSCRKPHADSLDALANAHFLFAERPGQDKSQAPARSPLQRPHQLFLTGDQIYADDVGSILLALIMDAAPVLIGVPEDLPGLAADGTDGTTARFGPWSRSGRMNQQANFTSTAAQSHLMSFGEYAMMYLFAYSDVLWPPLTDDLPGFAEVFPDVPLTEPFVNSDGSVDQQDSWAVKLDKAERPAQDAFRRSLERVRRLLANVPTYMILDDHDITDDWLMNRAFCERVFGTSSGSGSRLGNRIMVNALTAYAMFQSWGNTGDDPNQPMSKVLTPFGTWRDSKFDSNSPALTDLSDVLGLPTGRLPVPQNRGEVAKLPISPNAVTWSWFLKWDGHEAIAVDSRTRRGYPRSGRASPALIAEDEIPSQVGLPLDPALEDKITFVLLPGPLYTVPAQEDIQRDVKTEKDAFAQDVEVWGFDQTSMETLLSTLATRGTTRKRRMILLAGDVHYGFAYRLQYWSDRPLTDPSSPARSVFALMTSSALKNETDMPPTRVLHRTGFIALSPADRRFNLRLIWKVDPSRRTLRVAHEATTNTPMRAIVDRQVAAITSLSRAILQLGFDPFSTQIVFDKQPDSILLSTLIHSSDTRTATGGDLHDKPIDPELRFQLFLASNLLGKTAYYDTLRPGSELIGLNNIGLITIQDKTDPSDGTTQTFAVQEMFWQPGEPSVLYKRQKDGTLPPLTDPGARLEVLLTIEDPPAL